MKLEEWKWTPRSKEVVVMRDNDKYRYEGGCPGQLGRRRVTKFGVEVDELVEYYKGYGWLTAEEKNQKDARASMRKKKEKQL